MKPVLYLASRSARRKELLRRMKVRFKIISSSYNEKMIPGLGPRRLVLEHARKKAAHARVPEGGRWVLGADTIVYQNGKILGKPKDLKEAFRALEALSGRGHDVYTGIALLDFSSKKMRTVCVRTRVFMKKLSRAAIENYLARVNPLDKAGSYAIQEGPRIVARIVGSRTNVIGLPVEAVRKLLKETIDHRP